MKHKKKKNVGFLYECLTRTLTKSIIDEDLETKKKCSQIFKKHFSKKSELTEKLSLFKNILESSDLDIDVSNRLFFELKNINETRIDESKLEQRINALVSDMSKHLGKDVYNRVFIPNYQAIATINQAFSKQSNPKDRILCEKQIVNMMCKKTKAKELEPSDALIMKTFLQKFNERYQGFSTNQKKLLEFIVLDKKETPEFKDFLNTEIGNIKENLRNFSVTENDTLKELKEKTLELLEGFSKTNISQLPLEKLLEFQELNKQIQSEEKTSEVIA